MIRKVIEYLRKKNKITIEDLVVEICSSTMYYKYLSREKNLSKGKLIQIKERLGADELTKEEIAEFKKDLDKITLKIMRYYGSKDEFEKDISPLIELDTQLLLNEDLTIDYVLAKINYLLVISEIDEIISLLALLEDFLPVMTTTQKLMYYQNKILIMNYQKHDISTENEKFVNILDNNRYEKDYGCFHLSEAVYQIKFKNRAKALKFTELAIELFQRDINLVGIVKATNTECMMLGEERKYNVVLEKLLINYDNAKKINSEYEIFITLMNIIMAYLGLEDKINASRYWNILYKKFNLLANKNIRKVILNNISISLITNFEYYGLSNCLNQLIYLIEENKPLNNVAVMNLVEYNRIVSEEEKIIFIEKTLLPSIIGKTHFSYCKWILDTCIIYFTEKRMYKKAVEFETYYLKEFKEYYF